MEGYETVPLSEAKEQVRRVCERLALLHYAFAKAIVDKLGEEQGTQLVMNAIKLYGTVVGEEVRDAVLSRGLEDTPDNYGGDLPQYGMHDRVEAVGEGRKRVYGCVMGRIWHMLGADRLGRLYCYVDPCKYMAYNPTNKLVHHASLPDGDEYCEMSVEPTSAEDRAEFASQDPDLSKLDR